MKTTTAQQLVAFTAEQLKLHYGPGPHADGSPQTVHGGGAGGGALQQRGSQQRRPKQVGDIGGTYDAPRVDAKRLLKTRAEFRSDRAREWGGDAKQSAGARPKPDYSQRYYERAMGRNEDLARQFKAGERVGGKWRAGTGAGKYTWTNPDSDIVHELRLRSTTHSLKNTNGGPRHIVRAEIVAYHPGAPDKPALSLLYNKVFEGTGGNTGEAVARAEREMGDKIKRAFGIAAPRINRRT